MTFRTVERPVAPAWFDVYEHPGHPFHILLDPVLDGVGDVVGRLDGMVRMNRDPQIGHEP